MQVDFGDQGEPEHNLHLTANAHQQHAHTHGHYDHPGSGSAPPYSPFRHPGGGGGVPAIDPALHQSTGASRNVHTPMSAVPHQAQPNHLLQPDNAGHLSHGFYGDMRSSQTPPASANASPRFSAISPTSQPRQVQAHYEPSDRDPPSRDVADDTIDDAYAAFILYCNPNFPTTVDTTELLKLFRTPPKSDGNAFSTWTLFELIRKFDAKEIKTWTQLALDLGVKPPNTDEGQSTQKVQQYSVRLKVRTLQFTHAFVFFILAKCPVYFPTNALLRPVSCSASFFFYQQCVYACHPGRAARLLSASNGPLWSGPPNRSPAQFANCATRMCDMSLYGLYFFMMRLCSAQLTRCKSEGAGRRLELSHHVHLWLPHFKTPFVVLCAMIKIC